MINHLLDGKTVAVIGGGPVGLTMALLLEQKGVNVKLYERDVDLRSRITGGSLDLHQNTGQSALKEAGILDEFYAASWSTSERMGTIDGSIYAEELIEESRKKIKPEIDRNDLRALLCRHIGKDVIQWGRKLTLLELQKDKYVLHFEGGHSETVDVVIGANGGMSQLRAYVNNLIPQYSGTVLIQGDIESPPVQCPDFVKLCKDGNLMAIGEGHIISSHYVAGGGIVFEISFRQPENEFKEKGIDFSNHDAVINLLNDTFVNWGSAYKQMYRAANKFRCLPMRYIPLDIPWNVHHNITLIGDAAHLMPPFAGIGVNIGLVDALNLAENLTTGAFDSIDAAIADYENKMMVYARESLEVTLSAEINIHTNKSFDEILQSRNEWNDQIAGVETTQEAFNNNLIEFKKRIAGLPKFGKTLKFVLGEHIVFIDSTNITNKITPEDRQADCTVTISPDNFNYLISGRLSTMEAFTNKKLTVAGDMQVAMIVRDVFKVALV
ncbi:FAD-dependent monooxygenase [Chitinophagaceae bacterium LWZ2-11]